MLESRRIQYEIASGMVDEFHPDGEAYKVSLKELKNIEKNKETSIKMKLQQMTEGDIFTW